MSWRERCFVLAFLGSLSASLTGCSYLAEFIVVNVTSQPISLTYSPKVGEMVDPPQFAGISIRRSTRFGRLSAVDVERREPWAAVADVSREVGGALTIVIPPRGAVKIASAYNYAGPNLESWDDFPIERLWIRTSRGSLELCGPVVLMAFERSEEDAVLLVLDRPSRRSFGDCMDGE